MSKHDSNARDTAAEIRILDYLPGYYKELSEKKRWAELKKMQARLEETAGITQEELSQAIQKRLESKECEDTKKCKNLMKRFLKRLKKNHK